MITLNIIMNESVRRSLKRYESVRDVDEKTVRDVEKRHVYLRLNF